MRKAAKRASYIRHARLLQLKLPHPSRGAHGSQRYRTAVARGAASRKYLGGVVVRHRERHFVEEDIDLTSAADLRHQAASIEDGLLLYAGHARTVEHVSPETRKEGSKARRSGLPPALTQVRRVYLFHDDLSSALS